MTDQKNPLRTLATKIHKACASKGLKHTVILKVLTENEGYHSIQCTDKSSPSNVRSNNKSALPEHVYMHLKGLLCGVLSESSSYNFYEEGNLDATIELTGDSLTTGLLEMLKNDPLSLIYNADSYFQICYELCDSLATSIDNKEESSLISHFTSKSLPMSISKAFVSEIFDGVDHSLEFDDWIDEAVRLSYFQLNDLENVAKVLEESSLAQDALDYNSKTRDNIEKESELLSSFHEAIAASFVLTASDKTKILAGGNYSPYSLSGFDLDTVIVRKNDAIAMASNSTSLIPQLEQAQGVSVLKPVPLRKIAPELVKTLTMNAKDLEVWASMCKYEDYPLLSGFDRQSHLDELNENKTDLSYWAWVELQISSFISDAIEW